MDENVLHTDTEESVLTKPTYSGRVTSPYLNGEAKLIIDKDGLLADSLFEQASLSWQNYFGAFNPKLLCYHVTKH